MKPNIAVIDYGMGNLRSVAKALEFVGAKPVVTDSAKVIEGAQAIVFPGVGSFGPAVENLNRERLEDCIRSVLSKKKPFLGICLGFQLLFDKSEESADFNGLGVLRGQVIRFDFSDLRSGNAVRLKIPHMGWNRVKAKKNAAMFHGIPDDSYFYFVHSYYAYPADKEAIAGVTEYGVTFCSAAASGTMWACQFHPEKSGEHGLTLLKNFVRTITH